MFKNQLQELAQRSCFNLPSYACMREGPDHAPRFKASVNFNGEIFESPSYSPTLRQAEHAAAEVALNILSSRGAKSLTARVLDETGVYKNLLQETTHKAGLNLPVYTTIRTGPGHVPVFTCTVELAAMIFTGESAKTKKQAEKNAAIAAWSSLKKMPSFIPRKESLENYHNEEEQVIVTRVLSNFRPTKTGKQKDSQHSHSHPRRSRFTKPWRSDNYPSIKSNNSWKYIPSEFPPISPVSSSSSSRSVDGSHQFVDLLPPPPPRSTSKILPLTSRIGNIFIKEEGQNGEFDGPMTKKTNSTLQEQGLAHIRRLYLGQLSCAHMGIMGNYCDSLKGVAPAVQIRSVIPVCAAPPPSSSVQRTKPLTLNPPSPPQEPFTSSLRAEFVSDQVNSPTKPNLCPNHISSELSKLQLNEK